MSAIIFIKNVNDVQKYYFKSIWENKTVSIKNAASLFLSMAPVFCWSFQKEKKRTLQGKYYNFGWKKNKYVPEDVKFFLLISLPHILMVNVTLWWIF